MSDHHIMTTESSLGDVLSQKTLIKSADTDTLIDKIEQSGKSFEVVFNAAVKNMSNYTVEIPSNNKPNGNGTNGHHNGTNGHNKDG